MNEESDISQLFLREFIERIITEMPVAKEANIISPIIEEQASFQPQILQIKRPLLARPLEKKEEFEIINQPQKSMIIENQIRIQPKNIASPMKRSPLMHIASNFPQFSSFQLHLDSKYQINSLGKLSIILSNPAIQGIEFPGPGKNLLINRSGRIEDTKTTLKPEEVDAILSEVSQKTKIPIIPGVFKAALGNLIITAVISEFVGSRFIIQKKAYF